MNISYTALHQLTIPTLVAALTNTRQVLSKAEEYARTQHIEPTTYLTGRLAPDMFTYIEQIQYACFMALEIAGPLSGKEVPTLPYDEKTFDDLKKSIDVTIDFLRSVTPEDFETTRATSIPLFYDKEITFTPDTYIERVGMPNFFFHTVTAYGILRHLGVPLGKDDFLGALT